MDDSKYPIGEKVSLCDGAFKGMTGDITAVDGSRRLVDVIVDVFGNHSSSQFRMESILIDGMPLADRLRELGSEFAPLPHPPTNPTLDQLLLEQPHDDDVRLVYADWLEERGDPHAEYFHVQVELYRALTFEAPTEDLLEREFELREQLDPDWTNRVRRLTTRAPRVDLSDISTELAILAKPSIRMHPRAGHVPELDASKIGGVFLWPESEHWPVWENYQFASEPIDFDEDRFTGALPREGNDIPMAPVVQLNKRDFPIIEFPDGADLLQLFWLPFLDSWDGPRPMIFWRDSKSVQSARVEGPALTQYQRNCVPQECRIHAEEVVEYPLKSICDQYECDPDHEERMRSLASRIARTEADVHEDYVHSWSALQGNKVGGYPVTTQHELPLEFEGEEWEFLLSLGSRELNRQGARNIPIEDDILRGNFHLDHLLGETTRFARGDYFVLVQKDSTPWKVRGYADYT